MFLVINKNLSKLFSKKQNKQKKDKTELNSKSSRPQKKAKKSKSACTQMVKMKNDADIDLLLIAIVKIS